MAQTEGGGRLYQGRALRIGVMNFRLCLPPALTRGFATLPPETGALAEGAGAGGAGTQGTRAGAQATPGQCCLKD